MLCFWGLKCPSQRHFPPNLPSLRWLQDGAEECVGNGFVTHRGGHQRLAASLRRLDRRLDVCIAVDLWSSGHHQTGRKPGKWPFLDGDVVVITGLCYFCWFFDWILMICVMMVIIVVYFSGNCSWFSPYFGMLEPCWAQREAGIGDTRMLYT